MPDQMENFVLTISLLLIGMLLRRLPAMPRDAAQSLNLFVIYLSLPALVLIKVPQLEFNRELLVPGLMPWGMLLVSALLVLLLSRALKWDKEITGTLLLLVPLGNTSFLGIPMVNAFFGEEGIPYALIYDQFGSFLALATYGSLVAALYGRQEGKPTARGVLLKIATFPPFLALLLALCLRSWTPPPSLSALLGTLAATLVPLVMISVGLQLSPRLDRSTLAPLGLGLGIKLCLAPLLALIWVKMLGQEGLPVQVAVFEAGMPPMVSAGALAVVAGFSPRLTAALVGLGILLSFVTLPLLFRALYG